MKHLIMGTAGHVDHGKTALIKALTNIDCDTHKEEKERGITINLGFSHIDLPSGSSVGIIDVPGHKDFINTMVGGACGIDFVLLVISADSGIMPQTREHLNIIKTLNIKNAIIALTKIDLVDEELVELAKLEVMELLEETYFADAPIVGVSSITKEGIEELKVEIDNLITNIESKEKGSFFRMYIDRIFTVKGIGSVVTGSVLDGEIARGNDLFLLPNNKQRLRIRGIQRHGKEVNKVVSGDRAALNLTGLKSEDFNRGMVLTNKEIEPTNMIDAHISLFDNSDEIKLWSSVVFHSGTFISQAKMHLLNVDKVNAGEQAIVQLHLEKNAILLHKDKFIIRNTSGDKSYGGGVIIDAQPLHHRKRPEKLISELELLVSGVLNEGNISELIKIELKKESKPVSISELAEKLNILPNKIIKEINEINNIYYYKKDDLDFLILDIVEVNYINEIIFNIEAHHKKNNILMYGLEENEFYGKFNFSKNKTGKLYLNVLLEKMKNDGKIKPYKNTWIIENHTVDINSKTKHEIDWLEQIIKAYGAQKPVYEDIKKEAQERKINYDKLKLYLSYLNQENKIITCNNEFIHTSVADTYRKKTILLVNNNAEGVLSSDIRKTIDVTKKIILVLVGIYENEGLIKTKEVDNLITVTITPKGKAFL